MTRRAMELIGLKVPADLARKIRQLAREDDRTVSGYLRRLLSRLTEEQPRHDSKPERDDDR